MSITCDDEQWERLDALDDADTSGFGVENANVDSASETAPDDWEMLGDPSAHPTSPPAHHEALKHTNCLVRQAREEAESQRRRADEMERLLKEREDELQQQQQRVSMLEHEVELKAARAFAAAAAAATTTAHTSTDSASVAQEVFAPPLPRPHTHYTQGLRRRMPERSKTKQAGMAAKAAAARSKARLKKEQQPVRLGSTSHVVRQQPTLTPQPQQWFGHSHQQQQQPPHVQPPSYLQPRPHLHPHLHPHEQQQQQQQPQQHQPQQQQACRQMQVPGHRLASLQPCPGPGRSFSTQCDQSRGGRRVPQHSTSSASISRDPFAGLCDFQATQRCVN